MFQRAAIRCRTNGGFHASNIQQRKRLAPAALWINARVFYPCAKASTKAVSAALADRCQVATKPPSPARVRRRVSGLLVIGGELNRPYPSSDGAVKPTEFVAPSATTASARVPAVCGSSHLTGVLEVVRGSDAGSRMIGVDSRGRFNHNPSPTRSLGLEHEMRHRAEAMLALMLPRGFPDSTRFPYAQYSTWQFMGMAASAAAGVMSTQALLFAVGLGAGSIPLAAALNWVIKDGLGQLGGVAFSSLVNTRFDSNPRLWRMIAAVSLDLSTMLELLSPLAPGYFLLIASVANVGKNVSFLAASASRAAIHNMLAAKGNLADVTAKAGAQTIVACMVGTGVGIVLSSLLGTDIRAILPTCLLLSTFHLSTIYISVRRLGVPTFDTQRLGLVVDAYHRSHTMPTYQELAERERFVSYALSEQLGLDESPKATVGSRLEEAVRDREELEQICQACDGLPFLLSIRGDLSAGTGEVHVLLLEGCGPREVLAGGYLAHLARSVLIERALQRPRWKNLPPLPGAKSLSPLGELLPDLIVEALRRGAVSPTRNPLVSGEASLQESRRGIAADFISSAESAGWNTSVVFLERPGAARLRLIHGDVPNP